MLVAMVASATMATVAAPPAQGVVVTLRVEAEAPAPPLFDGTVSTVPHAVDGGDGSGSHPCWGPASATPAATATGALDDALHGAAISWRGNWNPSLRDFFVDRIGPYASAPPDHYWSLSVNGRFSAGGCQTQVADGDTIRFFYGPVTGIEPTGPPGESAGSAGGSPMQPTPGSKAVGPATKRVGRIAAAASRYLRRTAEAGEMWARLALSLRAGEDAARAAAGLLSGNPGHQRRDGSLEGDVNATAIAVLALKAKRPRRAVRAAAWLAAAQSTDGGFGYRAGAPSDVDTTGLATWALALMEHRQAARRGAAFIRALQAPDGGFPAQTGGDSNSQSTGLATVALRVAGIGPLRVLSALGHSPLDYLASLSRPNGSISYTPHSSPTPVWTTAQALLGLTTKAKLLGWDSGVASG